MLFSLFHCFVVFGSLLSRMTGGIFWLVFFFFLWIFLSYKGERRQTRKNTSCPLATAGGELDGGVPTKRGRDVRCLLAALALWRRLLLRCQAIVTHPVRKRFCQEPSRYLVSMPACTGGQGNGLVSLWQGVVFPPLIS